MLSMLVLTFAMIFTAEQGLPQGGVPDPTPKPDWVETLPGAVGRLYAIGTADLGASEAQAIKLAGDRARLEVVARLRTSIKGGTATTTKLIEFRRDTAAASAYGERATRDEVKVDAQAEDLPGLVVERTHLDTKSRTAYALAYLDLPMAQAALTARLEATVDARGRVGEQASRQARWHFRRIQGDLNRMDELSGLLSSVGNFTAFRANLETVRKGVSKRLSQLEAMNLPLVDLTKSTMSMRPNVELPIGILDTLESTISAMGPKFRNAGADFVLEFTFSGGDKGPEFLFAEMSFAAGVIYRIETQIRVLDALGSPLTKSTALSLSQAGTPGGLVEQFHRIFERKLVKILDDIQGELR